MNTEEKLNQLRRLTAELANLGGIQALLDWDQQVNMPRGGMEDRSAQAALVAGIMYDRATSPQLGTLIEDLASEIPDINADDDLAREIKVAKRDFEFKYYFCLTT